MNWPWAIMWGCQAGQAKACPYRKQYANRCLIFRQRGRFLDRTDPAPILEWRSAMRRGRARGAGTILDLSLWRPDRGPCRPGCRPNGRGCVAEATLVDILWAALVY